MRKKENKETLRLEDLNLKPETINRIRQEAKKLGVTNKTLIQIVLDSVMEELEFSIINPVKKIEKEKK